MRIRRIKHKNREQKIERDKGEREKNEGEQREKRETIQNFDILVNQNPSQ